MMLGLFGRPDGMARRSDGWNSGQMGVRTVWHVVWTDGTVDRWASGQDGTIVRTADS
jgi:hypothetical protein